MNTTEHRKKLIEVALPLEQINSEAQRRKLSAPKGYPTTIHKYWAQRPISICRAVIFCQLVDDPSAWPTRFTTEQAQVKERKRLFDLIEQLVKWENSTNEYVLNAARYEIARSIAWNRGDDPPAKVEPTEVLDYLQEHAPLVYDPFSGAGSIPLEAQRLGLRSHGSDLNPVAVLIGKALVEIPPKFAGQPPVNPDRDTHLRWSGSQGLANDVRYFGQWIRAEAERRIGHLYPEVEITELEVQEQPSLRPLKGLKLTVVAWIWARTVESPNPAANGARVPLVSSFMLSTKKGKKAWIEPIVDQNAPDGYRFVVRSGSISEESESKARAGTIARRTGGYCLLTGAPMPFEYIREQGKTNGLGSRLMALVADGPSGRIFLSAKDDQIQIAASAKSEWEPEGNIPNNPRDFKTPNYGLLRYADLFTHRQLAALTTLSDLVSQAREEVYIASLAAGLPRDSRLAEGGCGAEAYADAVATYLAFSIDRIVLRGSSLTGWIPINKAIRDSMPRQALAMTWDFAEGNPFGKSSCDVNTTLNAVVQCIESSLEFPKTSSIFSTSALDKFKIQNCVISTDPPYYDNVGYAELSDFFYIWIRKMLRDVWPDLLATLLVPKADELVATPYRHGGIQKAEAFFRHGMNAVLNQIVLNTNSDFPITIYYAFKQSEAQAEGVSSTGWATFLNAIANNDLIIDGTWPVKSERRARSNALGSNALATSIVLVCRRRPSSAKITTRAEFLRTLKQELPAALKLLQQGNIAPVDMAQASIGPGMAIFTRYAKVLEACDTPMTVETALQLINSALDEFLFEQDGDFDSYTRFAITWFETHGMQTADYGAAETLATARNVSVDGVKQAGLIESGGGSVRLLPRFAMQSDWDPFNDTSPTVWKATQYLIRCLEENGEQAAADLMRHLGSAADPARDLAYRLYQICERKKWTGEGKAYNGLVIAWPELLKLSQLDIQTQLI